VNLHDGNVHADLLDESYTSASGWTPSFSASATVNAIATAELNPFVELGVELAVDFMDGLVDLSSGIKANATLANRLTASTNVAASTGNSASIPGGSTNGVCETGLEYKSDFLFSISGFVTQYYSKNIWSVEVPVFDKCWSLGGS
jgi:hypothetical protein